MQRTYSVVSKRLRKHRSYSHNAVCRAKRSAVIICIVISVTVTLVAFGRMRMYYKHLRFVAVRQRDRRLFLSLSTYKLRRQLGAVSYLTVFKVYYIDRTVLCRILRKIVLVLSYVDGNQPCFYIGGSVDRHQRFTGSILRTA